MTGRWQVRNVRARGHRAHLLTRRELEELVRAPDLATLCDGLRVAGIPLADEHSCSPAALVSAVRRRAGAQLATLTQWCGPRVSAVAVLFADEDRRNLRTILRGAAEGVDATLRLAGTVPTPALPEQALEELTHQPTARAFAMLLAAWRHPLGHPLVAAIGAGQTDLVHLEFVLNHQFALHALSLAGGGPILDYVREVIDVENTLTALLLAERPANVDVRYAFLPGGRHIGIGDFEEAVSAGAGAAVRLARSWGESLPVAAVALGGNDAGAVDTALLRVQVREQRRAARRDPLGPAPLLSFVLGLRAQTADLRSVIWGLALAAPRHQHAAELVTVA